MDTATIIDQQYLNYLQGNHIFEDKWLLMQNLAIAGMRRKILNMLEISSGQRVLDLGCGFGALSIDLIAKVPVDVTGVDIDDNKVKSAVEISTAIMNAVESLPGTVSFKTDDGYNLAFGDNEFDWVISQHVFQHLVKPEKVLSEIYRVLKPGGHVCIIDVDDGLSISYPEQDAYRRLADLLAQVQKSRGGDRQIGRKLPYLMQKSGMSVRQTLPLVQAEYMSAENKKAMLPIMAQHFANVREEAVSLGLVEGLEFDALLRDLIALPLPFALEMDVQFIVIGQKAS